MKYLQGKFLKININHLFVDIFEKIPILGKRDKIQSVNEQFYIIEIKFQN